MKIIVRGAFNYDYDDVSTATGLRCVDETLTVQADKEECDINTLVKRFGLTGELPTNLRVPVNADFVAALDFKDAMNVIRESEVAFMGMPADVRSRFNHDAGKFVDFASDPANIAEMRKLGLAVPEAVPAAAPEPMLVRVVPEPVAS